MVENKTGKEHNIFLIILLAGILISIAVSFYSFFYKKNYDFFIETSCDPVNEVCFYRDCENNPDLCPPNNLSYYHKYTIKARDFKYCSNEDCTEVCKTGAIECAETKCTESDIGDGICASNFASQDVQSDIGTDNNKAE